MTETVINGFTVDLEDWYHGLTSTNRRPETWPDLESRVVPNTERLLALLEEHDVKATFFVLGNVAARFPQLVREIAGKGHEIGAHGFWHRKVHEMTSTAFGAELDESLAQLRPLAEGPIIGHRAPYFSINGHTLWAMNILRERGFLYDSSFFPTRSMFYGYPQAPRFPHELRAAKGRDASGAKPFFEIPVSTVRYLGITWPVGGGVYLRFLPYSIVRWALQSLNRQGQPAVLYLHPHDLDTGQTMMAADLRERIAHYHGRGGMEAKVRRLFEGFRFGPLCDLFSSLSGIEGRGENP